MYDLSRLQTNKRSIKQLLKKICKIQTTRYFIIMCLSAAGKSIQPLLPLRPFRPDFCCVIGRGAEPYSKVYSGNGQQLNGAVAVCPCLALINSQTTKAIIDKPGGKYSFDRRFVNSV